MPLVCAAYRSQVLAQLRVEEKTKQLCGADEMKESEVGECKQ